MSTAHNCVLPRQEQLQTEVPVNTLSRVRQAEPSVAGNLMQIHCLPVQTFPAAASLSPSQVNPLADTLRNYVLITLLNYSMQSRFHKGGESRRVRLLLGVSNSHQHTYFSDRTFPDDFGENFLGHFPHP